MFHLPEESLKRALEEKGMKELPVVQKKLLVRAVARVRMRAGGVRLGLRIL